MTLKALAELHHPHSIFFCCYLKMLFVDWCCCCCYVACIKYKINASFSWNIHSLIPTKGRTCSPRLWWTYIVCIYIGPGENLVFMRAISWQLKSVDVEKKVDYQITSFAETWLVCIVVRRVQLHVLKFYWKVSKDQRLRSKAAKKNTSLTLSS